MTSLYIVHQSVMIRAGPIGVVYRGGGTESPKLEPSVASRELGESMRGG